MAESHDLIDFNVIEGHKENIQALPGGRSAKALAQLYSPPLLGANPSPNDQHSERRAEFEKELATIDEADDPLDVYERYVKWTLDAYPSAQATPQSRLLPLLERATKAFQLSKDYKNDPRYLKLWLHYIRLFSDAPRETFVFLARHGIGEGLALYYEEFAAWLENAGRWIQAEEIYKMGMEKEARPSERLSRKFGEFERRKQARPEDVTEPSSPALPAVRPALAAKLDPFALSTPSPAQQQRDRGSGSQKPKSNKMAIFTDDEAPARPGSDSGSKGWDSIGSLADRKKENAMEAKPWVGEKLKSGKTNGGMQKMMVFKDQSSSHSMPRHLFPSPSSNHEQQCVFNEKTGRLECVFVNLEAVYPRGNMSVEYCFEELRAWHRGWLNKDWKKMKAEREGKRGKNEPLETHLDLPQQEVPLLDTDHNDETSQSRLKARGFKIFEDAKVNHHKEPRLGDKAGVLVEITKTLTLNDENDENRPPPTHCGDLAKISRHEERANRTRKIKIGEVKHIKNETQTIKLNMDSPQSKPRRRKSVAPEPTMTINTKEAIDDVYDIFSAPLLSQQQQQQEEASEDGSADETDDYTTDAESTATGKLSAAASEYGDDTRHELLEAQQDDEADDQTNVSAWSDFTSTKHVLPNETESAGHSAQITTLDGVDQTDEAAALGEHDNPHTRYLPVPPEDYGPPIVYQQLPNHRLPFMTPIVEHTESSLGIATQRTEKDYFGTKTPSRKNGIPDAFGEESDPPSSPFEDVTADMDEDKNRVLQPIKTKSTKGTLSLGQGSAKSQIDAKIAVHDLAEPTQKGPIIKDAQCNPMDPCLRQTILAQIKPPLSTFDGYYEHADTSLGKSADIRKYIRNQAKLKNNQSQSQERTTSVPPTIDLPGAQSAYTIKRELGAGTFAPVYLVENIVAASRLQDDESDGQPALGKVAHRRTLEAMKMEEPPSTWEFYILRAVHRRLGMNRAAESIVRAHEMHLFRDECFLIEEYRDQGTLLDLVNMARLDSGSGGGMDEMLAMWFTVEMLRVVEAMHSKQLIHGDLKGDNVLVRFDDTGMETDWNATYFPSGAHGWSSKGVCLIDFGRGIDMKHFEPQVAFIADWKTTEADCVEMRELRPWTYQIDYHGLAGIIHSLLFGKYMETIVEKGNSNNSTSASTSTSSIALHVPTLATSKTYRIRENFKRYWQTEIWHHVFHLLLNPLAHVAAEEGQKLPVVRGLRTCRESMEAWLEENCDRGIGLKGMISRMEAAVVERKKRKISKG